MYVHTKLVTSSTKVTENLPTTRQTQVEYVYSKKSYAYSTYIDAFVLHQHSFHIE